MAAAVTGAVIARCRRGLLTDGEEAEGVLSSRDRAIAQSMKVYINELGLYLRVIIYTRVPVELDRVAVRLLKITYCIITILRVIYMWISWSLF